MKNYVDNIVNPRYVFEKLGTENKVLSAVIEERNQFRDINEGCDLSKKTNEEPQ